MPKTEAAKRAARKYSKSPKGKLTRRRWNRSEKGKRYYAEYWSDPENKQRKRTRNAICERNRRQDPRYAAKCRERTKVWKRSAAGKNWQEKYKNRSRVSRAEWERNYRALPKRKTYTRDYRRRPNVKSKQLSRVREWKRREARLLTPWWLRHCAKNMGISPSPENLYRIKLKILERRSRRERQLIGAMIKAKELP